MEVVGRCFNSRLHSCTLEVFKALYKDGENVPNVKERSLLCEKRDSQDTRGWYGYLPSLLSAGIRQSHIVLQARIPSAYVGR
jgi:hypothetical protein